MTELHSDTGAVEKSRIPRLIVLDDNPGWGSLVSEVAEKVGYSASYATTHGEYIGTADCAPPDVLVLDLFMPEKDGIEMIADMAQWKESPLIILISGNSSVLLTSAVRLGRSKGLEIVGSLVKPFRLAELRTLLEEAARHFEDRRKPGQKVVDADANERSNEGSRDVAAESGTERPNVGHSLDPEAQDKMRPVTVASSLSESSSLRILREQLNGTKTGDIVKHSIAAINARFCLALWQTHLAALTALNDVPDRLTEAAGALLASGSGTEQAKRWRQALRTNMRTLASNQNLIWQITNSLRLAERGRSAIRSIDRVNEMISELQVLENAKRDSRGRMLVFYGDICRENDRLKRDLAALLAGLKRTMMRGQTATESAGSGRSTHRGGGTESAELIMFRGTMARNAGSESG
jgi:CheY-like chemotaxis protein